MPHKRGAGGAPTGAVGLSLFLHLPLIYGIPAYLQGTFSARAYFPRAKEVGATLMIAVGAMGAAILATEPSQDDRDVVTLELSKPQRGSVSKVPPPAEGSAPPADGGPPETQPKLPASTEAT